MWSYFNQMAKETKDGKRKGRNNKVKEKEEKRNHQNRKVGRDEIVGVDPTKIKPLRKKKKSRKPFHDAHWRA